MEEETCCAEWTSLGFPIASSGNPDDTVNIWYDYNPGSQYRVDKIYNSGFDGSTQPLVLDVTGTIAGFDELSFVADQKQQYVNFHNPEVNDCLFLMTLYVDGEPYWQSGYVEPGKGYYTIELSDPLPVGIYKGELRIQCFKANGTELNSAKVTFELTVQEET